jgi:transcription antitermination factor NusG
MDQAVGGRVQDGDVVTILEGPFAGLTGRWNGIAGQRVLIVVAQDGREVTVEMEPDWVDAASGKRSSVQNLGGLEFRQRNTG